MSITAQHAISSEQPRNETSTTISARWLQVAAVLLVVLVGFGTRITTYDRWYPFVDYTDEGVYVAWGMHIRGVSDETALLETYGQLSPAYTNMSAWMQAAYDSVKPHEYLLPAEYYLVQRFVAILMGIFTALALTVAVWNLVGGVAGTLTGLIWAASPLIVEYNSLAIPDPLVYVATSTALATGVLAWKQQSPRWVLASLIAAIVAIYAKYWLVAALAPSLIVGTWLTWKNPRKMLPWLIGYALVAGISAGYIIFGFNPLTNHNKMSRTGIGDLIARMTNVDRVTNNLNYSLLPMGLPFFAISVLAGIGAYGLSWVRGWRRVPLAILGILAVYLVIVIPMSAMISNIGTIIKIRHALPITVGLLVLWGLSIGQIIWTGQDALTNRFQRRWISAGVAAIIALILLPGYVVGNLNLVEKYSHEHVINILRNWSDDNLPVDGYVMFVGGGLTQLDRVWNRTWGAYIGDHPFVWWTETASEIINTPPEEYIERGIIYFTVNESDLRRIGRSREALETWTDALLLVKTFPTDAPEIEGDTTYVYRIAQPAQETSQIFGEQIELMGYDLDTTTLQAGESFTFRPYWQRVDDISANYNLFMHLHMEEDPTPLAQHDGALTVPERPTLAWDDPDEVYIGRDIVFTIPADVAPGEYVLTIGIYDYETGARLLNEEGNSFQMAITVE